MSILVAFSSKHGATQEIADRIVARLRAYGHQAEACPVKTVKDPSGYDAFVIGSAVYFGSWLKEAVDFARQHQETLRDHPVWLFSSGPLGSETTDAEGHDLREAADPKELPEMITSLKPRDHRVFFGKLDPDNFGFTERVIHALPAGKKLLIEGDFRDWDDIDSWAESIAHRLAETATVPR